MFKNEVDRKLEWVEEHLPQLAALPPDDVRRVVRNAVDQTKGMRVSIGLVGAIIGGVGGFLLIPYMLEAPVEKGEYAIAAGVCAFLATYIATRISDNILNKKIESIGLGF